jgi:hypothetical protein
MGRKPSYATFDRIRLALDCASPASLSVFAKAEGSSKQTVFKTGPGGGVGFVGRVGHVTIARSIANLVHMSLVLSIPYPAFSRTEFSKAEGGGARAGGLIGSAYARISAGSGSAARSGSPILATASQKSPRVQQTGGIDLRGVGSHMNYLRVARRPSKDGESTRKCPAIGHRGHDGNKRRESSYQGG